MLIKSSPENYFHQAVQILSAMPPFDKCSKQELLVYGELLLFNHTRQFMKEQPALLAPKVRDGIIDRLDIQPQILRNVLSGLRKKGLLVEDELVERYTMYYLQPLIFEFTDGEG
jgi:hypothetical protein